MELFTPAGDYLLVRQDEGKKMEGKIQLATEVRTPTGTVLAEGPDATGWAGQRVYFKEFAPIEVKLNDEKLLLLRTKDILGTLETQEEAADEQEANEPS